jgi:hypothetical protein
MCEGTHLLSTNVEQERVIFSLGHKRVVQHAPLSVEEGASCQAKCAREKRSTNWVGPRHSRAAIGYRGVAPCGAGGEDGNH